MQDRTHSVLRRPRVSAPARAIAAMHSQLQGTLRPLLASPAYFPLSVSLRPPTAFEPAPQILSALPSASSLASPTACLTVPLICFADPMTRSLSMGYPPVLSRSMEAAARTRDRC